jgi:hypothetical protein
VSAGRDSCGWNKAQAFTLAFPNYRWISIPGVTGMEAHIAAMVAKGWKDSECQIAKKVDPNRSAKMVDQIKAIQSALTVMEYELRKAQPPLISCKGCSRETDKPRRPYPEPQSLGKRDRYR